MRTIGRRLPSGGGPDRVAICSYCGVQWLRSQLTRDASGNLACPDDAPGLDVVSLTEGNARMMRGQRPKEIGPADGNYDRFVCPPSPGFVDPNGPPPSGPLFAALGDSITANPGNWAELVVNTLRPTNRGLFLRNVAIVGSFTGNLLSGSPSEYDLANLSYSALRARNVMVIASGTNDIANYAVGGALTPEIARDNILACADTARAAGWRVGCAPVLQRYGGTAPQQAAFDAGRATLNAYLASSVSHFDVPLVDISSLSVYLASDPTYFPDGVHPSALMYSLMEPVYRVTVSALLA